MKIFGGKIAEELAKDNQRAEYGGEEMQEISIQYWLEKKENEERRGYRTKIFLIKMIQALKKYFLRLLRVEKSKVGK